MSRRCFWLPPLVAALALLVTPLAAWAQNYPNKPIKMIVGFSPGTTTDIVARLLAQQLTQVNGWTVVVENRPGQGGSNAAIEMMRAEPDGYTLSMSASGPLVVNPAVNRKLPYNSVKDFTPISQMVEQSSVLVVRSDFPAKTVQELIALEKSKQGQFNYASIGAGTGNNLTTATFARRAGMKLVHVPYKGSPEAVGGILAGDIHMMFEGLPNTLSHIQAGTLRPLAVSSAKRLPQLPDVPTAAETGAEGFEMSTWIGLIAPPGLPQPITDLLSREVWKVMNTEEAKQRFAQLGLTPRMQKSSEEFREYIRTELVKWDRAVEEAGVRVE
jgi:tripartite-type tricarboxylate transporter receptor subunit TctC